MKIITIGKGDSILYNTFKQLNFICEEVNNTIDLNRKINTFLDYDTIINTLDEKVGNIEHMYELNSDMNSILSKFCNKNKIKYVYISTGLLYAHINEINDEESEINAYDDYTLTKFIGERYCTDKDLIIRTHNIFNDSINENNTLLSLMKDGKTFNNEVSFTYTIDIVRSIVTLLKNKQRGLFNVTSNGAISPHLLFPTDNLLPTPDPSLNRKLSPLKLFEHYITTKTIESMKKCMENL